MSLWMIFFWCKYERPSSTCFVYRRLSVSFSRPFVLIWSCIEPCNNQYRCRGWNISCIFENIKISKISKILWHFYIFDILQKMTILVIYITMDVTRWCSIQWLLVTSHLYHTLKLSFGRTILRYVRLMAWAVRLCLSSVMWRSTQRVLIFCNIFAPSNSLWTSAVGVRCAWLRIVSK